MTVESHAAPKEKKGLFGSILGKGKSIWAVALVCALLAVGGSLSILGDAAATATYYVLARDVPARTQITPDMLMEVVTSVDGVPPNAFDAVSVSEAEVFSKIALREGDLVTASNAGPLTRINENLPGNFVAASFQVTAENAVAGKVRAGDHIDVIAVSTEGPDGEVAKVVMHNVIVLDVAVAPSTIAQAATSGSEGDDALAADGPESEALRSGIPSVYTVGVSPEDATKLALIRTANVMVVLTGNEPTPNMNVQTGSTDVFGATPVGDSGAGTPGQIDKKGSTDAAAPAEGTTYTDPEGIEWTFQDTVWVADVNGAETTLADGAIPEGYQPPVD